MNPGRGAERDYLCVDQYIADAVGARALSTAFEIGFIDDLVRHTSRSLPALAETARLDRRGAMLLADLLGAARVLDFVGDLVQLTPDFRRALQFRDLMEAKLDFAATVAPDFFDLFTTLLTDPPAFFRQAKLFDLFSYDRCIDSTPENRASTVRWMRFTTSLTKYESAACLLNHDFSVYRRMLDVGGNSGEFALRVCREHPGLRATVYDLPVVCEIGEKHVAEEPEAGRISFERAAPGNGRLPENHDLITFKSMLHDWPDEQMRSFLQRAYDALLPGGSLIIFERSVVDTGERQLAYGQIPIALFFRSYRVPGDYTTALRQAGFTQIACTKIDLDMPFMLVTATK